MSDSESPSRNTNPGVWPVAALRILIVDDKPSVRAGIRLLLETHSNWEICGEASDGIEAVEKAAELMPDIILLDISMPKMDGLQALPLIREASPGSQVVVLTLHEYLETARLASQAGAAAYITKSLLIELIPTLEALQPDKNVM
jgi:DNA-binding NarL/FixJ family response regulator